MKLGLALIAIFLSVFFALTVALADSGVQGVSVKAPFDASVHGKAAKTTSAQMLYHGGPVMNLSTTVYVTYYGNFVTPATTKTESIINDFLLALSGSAPFSVNTLYNAPSAAVKGYIKGTYAFTQPSTGSSKNPNGTVYYDNYSQGASLGTSSIPKIVTHAIGAGLPADPNGVYLVITSPDVSISGFCKSFCAYHNTSATIVGGMQIRYALIPDPTQRCSGCNGGIAVYGDTVTPNGDMGADTMTDDIMHELSETVTDPDINAWYTKNGEEVGDLCNYVYDTNPPTLVKETSSGAHYNAVLNGHYYLIQLIWADAGAGYCAAQAPTP